MSTNILKNCDLLNSYINIILIYKVYILKKLIIFYFAIACFKQISFAQNSVQIARDSAQIKQKDSIQIAADSTQIGNPFKYQKIQFKQNGRIQFK